MRILLAVDGSPHATYAVESVGCLSSITDILVVHVLDLPRLAYPMLGQEIAKDLALTIEQAMREEAKQILQETHSRLSDMSAPVSEHLLEGSPAERILALADEQHVDLIVMGARGVSEFRELLIGSVSHQVVSYASCPVLIFHAPLRKLRHVLLPVHGPEDVAQAQHFLSTHPFPEQVAITAFTVVPIPRSLLRSGVSASEETIQRALESAETFIDQAVTNLKQLPYPVTGLVGMGAPAETILEQVPLSQADLILIGTHHHSTISRLLIGSVSHTVLHQAPCPVLVIR